ncbi:MAG: 2-amino-4-hydroxy-6-hydroxymethyldihydropteridine diphosphokinase [Clostridiales bacterium]|jgi:2-amino-4-hydroxy-6-hydroxymethyldihydropteridine diphosphokinase|nr:2-amino-4-hydroxy-6-hydroxymethyldihydropteridine diphosphokinase [Clostridiales bacterium]MDK2992491.1 2-amino-4-hydroxy-6-hydroxymethyldihydropteridine diphosphokinase [Clostridiales bacterium]
MGAKVNRVYLALGSNIGDRDRYIREAIDMLNGHEAIKIVKVSSTYNTAPVGYTDQVDFLNAAVAIDTTLSPRELLAACLDIEQRLGRVRTIRWGPRTIDIDIIFYDDLIIDDGILTVPHPRMHERGFVLRPLYDIAPNAVHPIYKKTVEQMYDEWKAKGDINSNV